MKQVNDQTDQKNSQFKTPTSAKPHPGYYFWMGAEDGEAGMGWEGPGKGRKKGRKGTRVGRGGRWVGWSRDGKARDEGEESSGGGM